MTSPNTFRTQEEMAAYLEACLKKPNTEMPAFIAKASSGDIARANQVCYRLRAMLGCLLKLIKRSLRRA